jgi:RNA polymerase primary sigma factor
MAQFDESLKTYLREISQHAVLTRKEEIQLFKRLKKGDKGAREQIVASNLRFVIKIALSFGNRGLPLADLIQEGNVGLLEVIEKYDYRKGFRFSTYAAFWIKQSIQLALRKHCSLIRLPIRKSRFMGKLNDMIGKFVQEKGREPTVAELASKAGIREKKMEQLLRMRESVLSLDTPREEEGANLLDSVPSPAETSPLEQCMQRQARFKISEVLRFLSEKERKIMRLRYGFTSGKALSLRKTSRLVGMSQEGVRRIERKALAKLQRPSIRARVEGLL